MKKETKEITLEGLDGAGKTTHIKKLTEELESLGLRIAIMASPGRNTWAGKILRANIGKMNPQRASKLFAYDIHRSQKRVPSSADLVLWDRGIESVLTSNSDDAEKDIGVTLAQTQHDQKTIYLSISPELSWEREAKASDHPIDFEWLQTKHTRYQRLLEKNPEKFDVIDASQPLDVVYQALWMLIRSNLEVEIEKQQKIHNLLMDTPGIIRFVIHDPVEVKPNVWLPMFVNIKQTMADTRVRDEITQHMLDMIQPGQYDSVLGLESGGTYYAVAIANALQLPVAFHRTKAKSYSGATGDIVGVPPTPGSRVLLVDDVFATGQSASRAEKRMAELGCVSELLTIFSYSSDVEMIQRLGIPATSLTYFKGIRQRAMQNNILTPEEVAKLTELVDIYRTTVFE